MCRYVYKKYQNVFKMYLQIITKGVDYNCQEAKEQRKMTNAQETLLNQIKEDLQLNKERIVKDNIPEGCNWWWVELTRKNQVAIRANTKSLEALEREGLIKIHGHEDLGCFNLDIVEVL